MNQKDDGHVGGEQFLLAHDGTTEGGVTGDTSDIHFTVMCFTSGYVCSTLKKQQRN
jgi:hypothetical protein